MFNLICLSNKSSSPFNQTRRIALALALAAGVAGCAVGEVYTRGQKITADQLELVPVGSSREQVMLALGTPTTTGLADGEVFYYISQTAGRTLAYQKPQVIDRRIVAVYLNDQSEVREIAEYGLKDGKVFDYLARRTPTGGKDLAFVSQLLGGLANPRL